MGNFFASMFTKSSSPQIPPPSTAALMEACMENDVNRVKSFVGTYLATYTTSNVGYVKPGTDPKLQQCLNCLQNGNAAIHAAVFKGNLEMVQFLVSCGASTSLKNNLGCFPIWLAAGYNHVEVLRYLLSMESNWEMETNSTGDSALLAAASRGNVECCRILIEAASTDLWSCKNNNGDTPLSVAIAGGHLIDDKQLPIILDLLLPKQTPQELLNQPNKQGLTPLLVSCERDWLNVCQALLNCGASISIRDAKGASPLCVAAFCGSKDVTRYLLASHKELLDVPNTTGCTPLWLAARTGNAAMVQILLDAGANSDLANNDGLTPLQAAEKYDKQAVLKVFEEFNQKQKENATQ